MKPHRLDPVSLIFGSVFFLLGGVFLVGGTTIPGSHVGRLWPIPLIALGLIVAAIAGRALAKGGSSQSGGEGPPD